MKKIAFALVVPAFLLVGCGSGAETGTTDNENGYLDGDFTYGKVNLPDGRVLECVTMKRGAGNTSWGGLDCNGWEATAP